MADKIAEKPDGTENRTNETKSRHRALLSDHHPAGPPFDDSGKRIKLCPPPQVPPPAILKPQINRYAIQFVDADRSLTYQAARLKGKYKIAYADCFAAALANRLDARVVTGDPEFKKLESEVAIEWVA